MRTAFLFLVPVLIIAACSEKPKPAPTKAEEAQAIAEVFETKVDYTVHHLDSTEVFAFLAGHTDAHGDSAVILDFYKRRGYQYAWFVNDSLSAAAGNLLGLMRMDSLVGASKADYEQARDLVQAFQSGDTVVVSKEQLRDAELALTAQFFHFADKSYGGFVQRDVRDLDWFIPRRKKDLHQLLDSLAAGRMDLSAYEPVHPQYQALKEQLKRYYGIQHNGPWGEVALEKKKTYAYGDSAAAVVLLRDHLYRLGDLAANDSSARFDSTLVMGVRSFQHRFGQKENGVVDAVFVRELNVPLEERIRQILVNMERLRWVNPTPPKDMILVNIPEYRLHVYEGGKEAWDMNVVVGATATRTAIFTGDLSLVVMAPYWNVPQSIIRSEILPAVKRNVGYLAKKEMEVVKGGTVVPASSIDWSKYSKGVPFTIRQKAGKQNALGQVKFLFPNEYSIYLHDTPSKSEFTADKPAFSHGCIRLSDPPKLADYLLRNDSTWTPAKIKEAMNGTKEVTVKLAAPMPVVLGYFTAWVDEQGQLNFRDDVYGNDAKLAAELFVTSEDVAQAANN
ncbi:MAG TPA: L,D-transpeptidase family protein [Flavobacteriales bacterium]|nr:L,D-transpeptidase family protein [Flavobacteriales bacterium]